MQRHGRRVALVAAILLALGIVGAGTVFAAQPKPIAQRVARIAQLEKLGRHIVHGTLVIQRPNGTLQTVQVDRGTIASISGGTLTISQPGATQVVGTDGQTRVRKGGMKSDVSRLTVGDKVLVVSDLTSGSPVADLIVVPRARPSLLPGTPTP